MHSLTSSNINITQDNEGREWRGWARGLQRWGLAGLASTLLESGGAFTTLAAQSLYIGQPLLDTWLAVGPLAQMLEDPQQTQAFAKMLREESQ
ncbi:MAG: hypothetical protein M1347_06220 [Chloroflexi bacterium]|nr:hypothetical protein [Chloroflexota bacterium]